MEEQGIVLEIDGDEVILLSSSGEFCRQPIIGEAPSIGAEIPLMKKPAVPIKGRFNTPLTWISVVAAAALVLAFSIDGLLGKPQEVLPPAEHPVTQLASAQILSVTVDINPSLELGFDSDAKVVLVKGLNEDGNKVIAALGEKALLGLAGETALEKITDQAMDMGYLTPEKGNAVVIALAGDETQMKEASLDERLKQSVQKSVAKRNLGTVIQSFKVSEETKKSAEEAGISPGKYAIYLESLDKGLKVSIDDFKHNSISKVIKEAGGNPGEIIGNASQDKDLADKQSRFKEHIRSEIANEKAKDKVQNKTPTEGKEDSRTSNNGIRQESIGKVFSGQRKKPLENRPFNDPEKTDEEKNN